MAATRIEDLFVFNSLNFEALENGYYSIDIAPTGALIVIVGTTNELREIKKRLEHNFVIEGGIALKNTVVTAKAKVATVDSMEVIDTGSTIECSSILTIPENIGRDFARCVFQPFVIDCQTGDTIEYRQPRVYDGKDYCFSKQYHLHIVDRVGGGDSFGGIF